MAFRIALAGVVAAGLAGGYLWSRPIDAQSGGVGGVEVTLSRSGDGHFYADALVNGKPVRFLVDQFQGDRPVHGSTDGVRIGGLRVAVAGL